MIEIKRFSELNTDIIDIIINKHFNHWSQYNNQMNIEDTTNKFKNIYAIDNNIPYGIAMFEDNKLIGFCVFKEHCLDHYLEYTPWISDVMIFDEYRGKGYGRKLIDYAKFELKNLGFDIAYLWTDKAPIFYEKIGFEYIKDVLKNDESGYGRLYSIKLK